MAPGWHSGALADYFNSKQGRQGQRRQGQRRQGQCSIGKPGNAKAPQSAEAWRGAARVHVGGVVSVATAGDGGVTPTEGDANVGPVMPMVVVEHAPWPPSTASS